jgi:mannose-6-phosphate isomerase-like protein (cupin superfamily)
MPKHDDLEYQIRPWGTFEVLSDAPDHKVKRIVISPGKRLSLQLHSRRSEHWYVVKGLGVITLDDKMVEARPGRAVDIPVGTKHRIKNTGTEELVFIEVQTGEYFGEDDIQRFKDDFGRT